MDSEKSTNLFEVRKYILPNLLSNNSCTLLINFQL